MKALLQNIQTIKEYLFDLPDTGIVEFVGSNSNGKSVLGKAIVGVVTQNIKNEEDRLPLISDGCESGVVALEYKEKSLVCGIHRDVNKCYYLLQRADGTQIRRTFREKGIDELIREFGFLVYDKNSLCLQVYETFGVIPMINSRPALTLEIATDVITDRPSELLTNNYANLTYPEFKKHLSDLSKKRDAQKSKLETLHYKDVRDHSKLAVRMKKCYNRSEYLKYMPEIDIPLPPNTQVKFKTFDPIEDIPIFNPLPQFKPLFNMTQILIDLEKIEDGRCPTCGKRLLDGGIHEHRR